ncbi:MAG: PilZ domain-containing protein [Candidatus Scalindua sp. AMX11]|nr:MAG: PilZ domain-containing protein [Candidatus Scalindua sp.]NOG82678.1 PilZ domain-containing protein [Planctomycetota bacterium]RZV95252.1 MAG: PilZ domain-containing protein [Candidatus Scalindua sp. SCAELEC01]TDE66268.1 MAG: PilZ domain-containing protein [Candidatus Scalindua sp. AMX11]GJQ57891.1 MAG: hypothetical protein SCALA701_06920 [Candidatus Scalindua sp.]
MKTENRTHPRIDVKLSITRLGAALNISESGMCILVDEPLPIDYEVKLSLTLPHLDNEGDKTSNTIQVEGVIVWTKFLEQLDKYEAGIKFSKLEGENRVQVKAFLEKHTQNSPE